jgi:hypothetical protein
MAEKKGPFSTSGRDARSSAARASSGSCVSRTLAAMVSGRSASGAGAGGDDGDSVLSGSGSGPARCGCGDDGFEGGADIIANFEDGG